MPHQAVIFVALVPPFAPKGAAKPFAKVDNREVFMRTIEIYANRDSVEQRILVVHPDDLATIQARYAAHLGFQGVSVTAGGPDWFGAVARAMEKLKPEIQTVFIHDAVRPAVPYTVLDALETALSTADAAVPVIPFTTALATIAADRTLDAHQLPSSLFEVQSPQLFQRAALEAAYANRANFPQKNLLDDAALLRAAGSKVATVPGSRFNQRVDADESIRLATDFLKHLPKPRSKAPLSPFDEAQW